MIRALAVAAAASLALAAAAPAAQAATARQATNRVASCLQRHAHAVRIVRHAHGREGTAWWRGQRVYVSWAFVTSASGRVLGVNAISEHLTAKRRKAANGCLRPYHGRLPR